MKNWIVTFSLTIAFCCAMQIESNAQDSMPQDNSVLIQDSTPVINAPSVDAQFQEPVMQDSYAQPTQESYPQPMQESYPQPMQDSYTQPMQDSYMPAPMMAPVGSDCGCQQPCDCCGPEPCQQRKKRFQRVTYQKEVCRLKKVCVTDECGCTKSKLMRVPTTVTRSRLVRVPKDPCEPGCLENVRDRLRCARDKIRARLAPKCDRGCDPCQGTSDCGCGCN